MIIGRWISLVMVLGMVALSSGKVEAHGERSQEPFLRMRTILYYDTNYSKTNLKLGERLELTGKFHTMSEWPQGVDFPESAYLHFAEPGPSLIKKESWLNGVPVVNATSIKPGQDYEYRLLIEARRPGRFHLHPMVNIQGGGALVGPGMWITNEGDPSVYKNMLTTMTGESFDLETWGLGRVLFWWGLWSIIAIAWLIFWLRRPFASRLLMVGKVPEKELVSDTDYRVSVAFLIGTFLLIGISYFQATAAYPTTIPLQTGRIDVPDTPPGPQFAKVASKEAAYKLGGRTMLLTLDVTNITNKPIRIGGFATANIEFSNGALFPEAPLKFTSLEPDDPINPGETKTVKIEATDALWEYERLYELIYDTDSRYGGLLFVFDEEKNRQVLPIGGPIFPLL